MLSLKNIRLHRVKDNLRNAIGVYGGFYRKGPVSATFFMTDRCNLRCKMCANQGEHIDRESLLFHPRTRDVTLELVKKTLEIFPTLKNIGFVGTGEPLLVNGLFEMISMAVSKGMNCSLVTNGVLLENNIDRVIKSGFRNISISLNSASPNEYSLLTGVAPSTFFRVGEAVKKLVKKRNETELKLKINVSSVIDRSSIVKIPELISYADYLGIDELNLHSIIPNPSFPNTYDLLLREQDKPTLKRYYSLSIKNKVNVTLPILIKDVPRGNCYSFFQRINIDGDGNVGGCMRVMPPKRENGNIFEGFKVWNNQYFTEWRNKVLNGELLHETTCRYCVECSK